MFFYLVHHILRVIPGVKESSNLKLNCTTLLIGTALHIMMTGYLRTASIGRENSFIGNLFRWYYYLIVADIIAVGVLYKEFYGRSILAEAEKPSKWEWDEEKDKYKEKREAKADRSEEAIQMATELGNEIDDTRERLVETRDKVEEIDMAIRYHPDGEIAKQLKEDYEILKNERDHS